MKHKHVIDVLKGNEWLYIVGNISLFEQELMHMTVKERIHTLRLLEKQRKNPELAKKLGISVRMKKKENENDFCNKDKR